MSIRTGKRLFTRASTFVLSLFIALSGLVITRSILGTEQSVEASGCGEPCGYLTGRSCSGPYCVNCNSVLAGTCIC
jgi:hypothetical protein